MKICRITKITPDGKPWESQYGTMYPMYVVFADGTAGQVNSKTEQPAYKAGEEVGYEITGSSPRGVPKLKIDRKADPSKCINTTPKDGHPELEAAASPQKPSYTPQSAQTHTQTAPTSQVHAATACWAVGKAVEIAIAENNTDGASIERKARQLLSIQQSIEHGETAPF